MSSHTRRLEAGPPSNGATPLDTHMAPVATPIITAPTHAHAHAHAHGGLANMTKIGVRQTKGRSSKARAKRRLARAGAGQPLIKDWLAAVVS